MNDAEKEMWQVTYMIAIHGLLAVAPLDRVNEEARKIADQAVMDLTEVLEIE